MTFKKFKVIAWGMIVACVFAAGTSLWLNEVRYAAMFGLAAAAPAFFLIDPTARKRRAHVQ